MVNRFVRVYIEGGAKGRTADNDFRRCWRKFLNELHDLARSLGYQGLDVVRGTGRGHAYKSFVKHEKQYPRDLCVLLVDSETAVPDGRHVWDVVANREGDQWSRPAWATERHLYLMTQFVETWLLTDVDALKRFFKNGFNAKGLYNTDLENRSKEDIEDALLKATRDVKKGKYRHGQAHEIIELVRPERVRTLTHGQRLFDVLSSLIRDEASQ